MSDQSLIPDRGQLPHHVPHWVRSGSLYFITICCTPRRHNHLCRPEVANPIRESATYRQQAGIWFVPLLLLMPDHLHALIAFHPDAELKRVIRDWKSYLRRTYAVSWQRDFFEHRLRNQTERAEKFDYIRKNPVRGGLVQRAEDWPYGWTFETDLRRRV